MKIIIADKIINLDACGILDIAELTQGEHILRNFCQPLHTFASHNAAITAIDSIQNAVRHNFQWIEIDAISGQPIDGV